MIMALSLLSLWNWVAREGKARAGTSALDFVMRGLDPRIQLLRRKMGSPD
jgi:hypothetical protein